MNAYTSYSDGQLLELLANHDRAAFTAIYDRYWKLMLTIAVIRIKRLEVAEDIIQEVFTMLWARATEQTIVDLGGWLATAVKYKVITVTGRELRMQLRPELPELPSIDREAEYRFLEQAMQKVISRLPERCKLVFHYHQRHYSNRAIAREMGITEKAVEKHLTKARFNLRLAFRQFLSVFL